MRPFTKEEAEAFQAQIDREVAQARARRKRRRAA